MLRDSFLNKYKDLPARWNIESDLCFYIIRRYEKLLLEAMTNLAEEKFQLPKYFQDQRSDEEYLYDLVDGWVVEDIICDAWLRPRLMNVRKDIEVKIMGTNRDRVVQKYNPNKITTDPDFIFTFRGRNVGLELQMARKELSNGYDMKVGKVEKAIAASGYFLWVILPINKFFLINAALELKNIKATPNPMWGNKLVYHISQEFINIAGGYSEMNKELSSINISKLGL